ERPDGDAGNDGRDVIRRTRAAEIGPAPARIGQADDDVGAVEPGREILRPLIQRRLAGRVTGLLRFVADAARRIDDPAEPAFDHVREEPVTHHVDGDEVDPEAQIEIFDRRLVVIATICDLYRRVVEYDIDRLPLRFDRIEHGDNLVM